MKMLNLVCDHRLSSFITYIHSLLMWLSLRLGDSDKINSIPVLFFSSLFRILPGIYSRVRNITPWWNSTGWTWPDIHPRHPMYDTTAMSVCNDQVLYFYSILLSYLSVMTRYFYYMHRGIIRDPVSTFWIYMVDGDLKSFLWFCFNLATDPLIRNAQGFT